MTGGWDCQVRTRTPPIMSIKFELPALSRRSCMSRMKWPAKKGKCNACKSPSLVPGIPSPTARDGASPPRPAAVAVNGPAKVAGNRRCSDGTPVASTFRSSPGERPKSSGAAPDPIRWTSKLSPPRLLPIVPAIRSLWFRKTSIRSAILRLRNGSSTRSGWQTHAVPGL